MATTLISPSSLATLGINASSHQSSQFLLNSTLSLQIQSTDYDATSYFIPTIKPSASGSSKNVLSTITKINATTTSTSPSATASSSVLPTSISTTALLPTPVPSEHKSTLLYYVGIPVAIVAFILLLLVCVKCWRWYKRKRHLQKEFTPCYSYDQSENEVVDGVLYPSGTNSVDLLHVDASPPVPRLNGEEDDDDNDESCLLGNYQPSRELNDFASDTKRCESIAV